LNPIERPTKGVLAISRKNGYERGKDEAPSASGTVNA
jgi:hypothetical protein